MQTPAFKGLVLALVGMFLGGDLAAQEAVPDKSLLPVRPRLGVRIQGLVLEEVQEKSVAATAGLKSGDVLLDWENRGIVDVGDLGDRLGRLKGGETCTARVLRGGETSEVPCRFPGNFPKGAPRLGVTPLPGVRVEEVLSDSTAARGGVQAGDVILALGGREINSYDGLVRLVAQIRWGGTLPVLVWRDGGETEIKLDFSLPEGVSPGVIQVSPQVIPQQRLLVPSQSLAEMKSVADDLEAALGILRKHGENQKIVRAIVHIEKAHAAAAATIRAFENAGTQVDIWMRGVRNLRGRLGDLENLLSDGSLGADAEQLRRRLDDLVRDDIRENLRARLDELLQEDLPFGKLMEILRKEFPGTVFEWRKSADGKTTPGAKKADPGKSTEKSGKKDG